MKKFTLAALSMFIVAVGFSQIKHNKFTTVITFDQFNPFSYFYQTSVSEIKDNSGYFLSNFYDDQAYGFNPALVKLDVDGNILMDTVYDFIPFSSSSYTNVVNSVTTSTDHCVLYNTSAIDSFGNFTSPYVLKYDLNGNILWHYGYTNDSLDLVPNKLIGTQDGGYMIIGQMVDYFNGILPQSGYAIKLDANGTMQWHQMYSTKDTMEYGFSNGLQMPNGNFFFVGEGHNSQGGLKPLDPSENIVAMVETDNSGNLVWDKAVAFSSPIDNTNGFYDFSCGLLNDSTVFVSCAVYDSVNFVQKFAVTSVNLNNGITDWTKYYSLPAGLEVNIRKAIVSSKGNIIVTASDYNNVTGVLFELDNQGNFLQSKRFVLGANANFPYEIINTLDGGLMHVSEIDQNKVLLVKTDKTIDPSCPDVDSTYNTLTGTINIDSSYFNITDTIYTVNGLNAAQLSMGSPTATVSNDSLICSCMNTITGTVWDGGNPAQNAKLFLFKKGVVPKLWKAIDSTYSDAAGAYIFNYVPTDSFLIRVVPDPVFSPNAITSYHKQSSFCYKWDSAGVFHVHCDSASIVKDINLITPPPLTGNSSLNGYILENTGGFSKQQPGDPIPGIDITVEQSPGGIVGLSTSNSSGYYELPNISNSSTYIISVDLPGLPNDSVYTMTINGTDTILDSLNFYVDGTGIYILTDGLVGVNVINNNDLKVELFPNPTVSNVNLSVYAIKSENIAFELTNKVGQVISSVSKTVQKGENTIVLGTDELPPGIYFLKIKQGNNLYLKKLIKL